MKLNFDLVVATAIAVLLILTMHLYSMVKNTQVEIAELRIIVDQKFLPAMILDQAVLREDHGKTN